MSEQELEKLYNEAYKAVYWTAFSILKNNEDAEDVVQETFVTAFEQYDSLQDKSKAVAWVKKIAANKSLNIVTRKRTINIDDEILEETEDIGEDFLPDSLVESAETRKIIMDIIHNTLSEDTAMTLILFYFDEMSIKEIAELLHIPQGTVLSRLNYAKKKIKKEVEKYEKENKDKLFAMGIPFLTKLFEKEAEQVPFRPMPASLLNLSTASSKATAGAVAASGAGAASAAIVVRNIIIGILAAGAIGGAVYFGYQALINRKDKTPKRSSTKVTTETTEDSAFEPSESEKVINVRGMTPDQLDLPGGYVRTSTYHDEKEGTQKEDHQQYYNADGLLVLDCLFNEDGVVVDSHYYVYDADGRILREELWGVSVNDNGLFKEYSYGANGIERVDTGYFEREPDHYYIYEYDLQGRLIKETEYTVKQGYTYWFCDYEYQDDGTYITRVTSFDTLNQEMRQSKDYCVYSEDGKLLEYNKASWKERYVYTYDSEGKMTLEEKYDGSKLKYSTTYEYDEQGRLISAKTVLKDGVAAWDYTYEYRDL